jgi:2-C-methyl-D-erythritol 4-phosphate cytidylyltransferase
VANALAKVSADADFVCVHDAVRPCVSPLWLDAVFKEAAKTGAAILAYPVHGTLKKVSAAGVIDETVSRADLWEAQTPQVFARELLLRAYGSGKSATDDAGLVEAIGHPVSVVPGPGRSGHRFPAKTQAQSHRAFRRGAVVNHGRVFLRHNL